MADYHNPSDQANGAEANNGNGFESFQRQLDAFLEQQKKAATDGAEHGSNELQHRLDHFINKLQQKLDTFIEENPAHSSIVSFADENKAKAQSGQSEEIPTQRAKKQPVPEFPVMVGSTNATSYTKLIASVLIAASCAVAAMLWLGWPVKQADLPQLVQQQGMDEQPVAPAPEMPETLARIAVHKTSEAVLKKPASSPSIAKKHDFKKMEPIQLSKPVLAVQSNPAGQHKIPIVEKAVQPKASNTVRLTVTARVGNIRNKPDKSGKVLFRLARGAVVTKLGEQKGWFKVRLRNGTVAWAHRSIF